MLLLVPQTTPVSARANSKDVDDASVLKGVAHILSLDVNETTKERHLLILLIPKPLSVSFLFRTSEKNITVKLARLTHPEPC